jgi:hypothetical protein
MLYPQYESDFTEKVISQSTWKALQNEAKRRLDEIEIEGEVASDRVIAHWGKIVNGTVPFGYSIKED